MKVWIVNKDNSNDDNISKKLLSYVYYQEKREKIDFDKIKYGQYGKPYYINNFFYNISHCKNYICIVVSNSEVGIDIEEERNVISDLRGKILTDDELLINNINLIEYWVIKESYSKFKGLGLYMKFNDISVLQIKRNLNVYNLCSDKYYCYVIGTESLEDVYFLSVKDLL